MNNEILTIERIRNGLLKKEFSALELTKHYLKKIEREDKKVMAFLTISEDLALEQAKKIDELIEKKEDLPPLAGVPCAIKDNILVEGIKCTAASKILENYIAPYDATAVKRLKESGAIILGKTNLDEFAMGSSTEYSAFFKTKNPLDLERVPGGSSGGSAAAVCANFAIFSLGSDTGGSIRQPAAFCGVVGLKPTYGTVSRYGLIAFASSLDQIGPLTKNINDCKIVFDIIKGKDEKDSTSVDLKDDFEPSNFDIKNVRIGLPKEFFINGINTKIESRIKEAIRFYEKMGAKIVEISLPHTRYALACYFLISRAEASSNLARYDGIRYGLSETSSSGLKNFWDYYCKIRGNGFGKEVRRRIMLGTFILSVGFYDAYYLRAAKIRTLMIKDFERAFNEVDFILTPTTPDLPFKIGEKEEDPLEMYLSDIFTVSANLVGLPALSFPVGKVDNFYASLQIMGKWFDEAKMFELAKLYERYYDDK